MKRLNLAPLGAALKAAAPALIRDGAGLSGVALIAYGAWLVYEPAGFIVAGTLLVAGALLAGGAKAS